MKKRAQDPQAWDVQRTLKAVSAACARDMFGWAEARDISKFSHPAWRRPHGALIAPTLTVLLRWDKPLIETRDGHYHKEYRLTAAGERARKDAGVSPIPD
jgi:hypothetical protein